VTIPGEVGARDLRVGDCCGLRWRSRNGRPRQVLLPLVAQQEPEDTGSHDTVRRWMAGLHVCAELKAEQVLLLFPLFIALVCIVLQNGAYRPRAGGAIWPRIEIELPFLHTTQ
jgi:hypothetical protein